MSRRRKVWLGLGAAVLVAAGAFALALPEIVRRVALAQIPKATGRAASIEDVDLNLLTGRFAIKKLRLADRDGPDAFVELERLDGRVDYLPLLGGHVRLTELTLTAPTVRVIRTGPREFNFSDLIPAPGRPPSRWVVTIERLAVARGAVMAQDRAARPAQQWRIWDLDVEGGALTTRRDQAAGRVAARAQLDRAKVRVSAESLGLGAGSPALRLAVEGFDLTSVAAYLPPEMPARPQAGTLSFALALGASRTAEGITAARLSGETRLEGLSVIGPAGSAPFLKVARLAVAIQEADLLARALTLGSVEVEGLHLKVVRDKAGEVDLLRMLREHRARPAGPAAAAPAAEGEGASRRQGVRVKRLALGSGTIVFTDEAVSPSRDWRLEDLSADASDLSTWSGEEPGRLALRARLAGGAAGGAAVAVDLSALRLTPLSASLRASLEGFALAEVSPYLPAGAPVAPSSGMLDLDLGAELALGDRGLARAIVTGRVQAEGLALTAAGAPEPFATVPRLALEVRRADLLAREATLGSATAEGLDLRLVRTPAGTIAIAAPSSPGASPPPAPVAGAGAAAEDGVAPPFRVRLERLALRAGRATLRDETVSPARQWRVEGVAVDGARLSTSAEDPAGSLQLRARVASGPGAAKPATVALVTDSLRLAPLSASARLSLAGFEIEDVRPYLPPTLPAVPARGALELALDVAVERGSAGLSRAVVAGSAELRGLSLIQRGRSAPFLTIPRLALALTEADVLSRTVTLARVEVEGLDLRAVRDARGDIDLLRLAWAGGREAPGAPAAPASPPPAASSAAGQLWRVRVDRFALSKGTATFEDRATAPTTTLVVSDLAISAENVTWPSTGRGTLTLTAGLPGGGLLLVEGTAAPAPLDAVVGISMLDAPIQPYQAYLPFSARLAGLFSGDSLTHVKVEDGRLIAASQGNGWIKDFQVYPQESSIPAVQLGRLEIRGIDFAWPTYAFVDRITLTRPEIRVERDPGGAINLRTMFQRTMFQVRAGAARTALAPPRPAEGPRRPGLLETMVLDFREIVIDDGYARFLDRTTRPSFSQDISRLALTIRGLSNAPGRRAQLGAQAIVGGDAALDLRGELSRLGEDLYADLVGELRDFTLTSVNPYADGWISWIVRRGKLAARVHYRLEQDRLTGEHQVRLGNLEVAPAGATDEVKRRIGLPLGLIVALLKDTRGDITLSVPLSGSWSDRRFDWGEAVWSAVRQVIVKALAAPFRAIGRLFTGGGRDEKVEELTVRPVTFSAGSSVLGPAAEGHLNRVADFLRRSPFVKLTLAPVATLKDVESIRGQEVTAKVQRLQRERGIPDFAAALGLYFREQVTGATPPRMPDEQLAVLRARESVPPERVRELLARRLEGTREALVKIEGIPADRLRFAPPRELTAEPGEGRVEFTVTAD